MHQFTSQLQMKPVPNYTVLVDRGRPLNKEPVSYDVCTEVTHWVTPVQRRSQVKISGGAKFRKRQKFRKGQISREAKISGGTKFLPLSKFDPSEIFASS